uniref:Putative secreted protein n=1 Tax=Anopheles darlingi TaxID=43151 RepID=A0A2M4DGI2_ANODA
MAFAPVDDANSHTIFIYWVLSVALLGFTRTHRLQWTQAQADKTAKGRTNGHTQHLGRSDQSNQSICELRAAVH